ncbi:MAG: hypothetical protein HQM05_16290 [Magnetococcales bacterium]|nr:hypothetical protein [Magnetococcales bacterium]
MVGDRSLWHLLLLWSILYGVGESWAAERFERRPEDGDRYRTTLGQREGQARKEWQPGDGSAPGDFVLGGGGNREAHEEGTVRGAVAPGLQGSRGSGRPQNAIQERRSQGDLP